MTGGGYTKTIGVYNNGSWRNAGQLNDVRLHHSAIILGHNLFILGGFGFQGFGRPNTG